MLSTAFSLAIVGYVINLAMGRTLAAKHGYDVDPNQVEKLLLTAVNLTVQLKWIWLHLYSLLIGDVGSWLQQLPWVLL